MIPKQNWRERETKMMKEFEAYFDQFRDESSDYTTEELKEAVAKLSAADVLSPKKQAKMDAVCEELQERTGK